MVVALPPTFQTLLLVLLPPTRFKVVTQVFGVVTARRAPPVVSMARAMAVARHLALERAFVVLDLLVLTVLLALLITGVRTASSATAAAVMVLAMAVERQVVLVAAFVTPQTHLRLMVRSATRAHQDFTALHALNVLQLVVLTENVATALTVMVVANVIWVGPTQHAPPVILPSHGPLHLVPAAFLVQVWIQARLVSLWVSHAMVMVPSIC